MLRNYFKIALRNLIKNKIYSLINIAGLATGMAVAMIIGLWINDELSYNKYFKNFSRIGRIMNNQTFNGETGTSEAVAIPLSDELRNKYEGDFEKVALSSWNFKHVLSYGDKKISAPGMFVQPDFLKIITLTMISGNSNMLDDPTSVLLSQSLAISIFGNDNPIGKILKRNNKANFKVGGVFEDFPHNTEFRETKLLLPWSAYLIDQPWVKRSETQWDNHSFQLLVLLHEKAEFETVAYKIKNIPKAHPETRSAKESTYLHPMSQWHLYSDFKNGKSIGGRITFVLLFGTIGVFVLLLACINFMNLSTARSERRAKEVGIRKAIGSLRSQIILQFMSESLLVVFIALVVALLLVQINLTWFNQLADKKMAIQWSNPIFWALVIGFALFTGVVSGSYPAFYLSSFNAVKVLKGTFKAGRFAAMPRKVMVVLQFTVSIILIIGTIVVFRQIQFAKNRPIWLQS